MLEVLRALRSHAASVALGTSGSWDRAFAEMPTGPVIRWTMRLQGTSCNYPGTGGNRLQWTVSCAAPR